MEAIKQFFSDYMAVIIVVAVVAAVVIPIMCAFVSFAKSLYGDIYRDDNLKDLYDNVRKECIDKQKGGSNETAEN